MTISPVQAVEGHLCLSTEEEKLHTACCLPLAATLQGWGSWSLCRSGSVNSKRQGEGEGDTMLFRMSQVEQSHHLCLQSKNSKVLSVEYYTMKPKNPECHFPIWNGTWSCMSISMHACMCVCIFACLCVGVRRKWEWGKEKKGKGQIGNWSENSAKSWDNLQQVEWLKTSIVR